MDSKTMTRSGGYSSRDGDRQRELACRSCGRSRRRPRRRSRLTPIQPLVEYTIPTKEEAAQCTIRPEKENNITSWVVRNRQGEILRRFADTNSDNVVDHVVLLPRRPRGVPRHRFELQRQGRPVSLVQHGRHALGRSTRTKTARSIRGKRFRRTRLRSKWFSR